MNINQILVDYEKRKIYLKLIKNIKSGKEATVYLVKDSNEILYALKIYKDIYIRTFHKRDTYLQGIYIKKPSLRRAVANNTKLGKEYIQARWIKKEVEIFKKLNKKEASAPHLYAHTNNSLLMEYLGTVSQNAPRLIDSKIKSELVDGVYLSIFETLQALLDIGYAHGDLSEYNILVWKELPYFIDFPQCVNLKTNPDALNIFMRDIDQISRYFEKAYKYKNVNTKTDFKALVKERFSKGV